VVIDADPVPAGLLTPYPRVLRIGRPREAAVPEPVPDSADVTERLMRHRVIYLGSEIDDAAANRLTAQLLLLEAEDPNADIAFYLNSQGGSVSAAMAIVDTMRLVKPDVATWVMGLAAGSAQLLATCGAPGKRHALTNARLMLRQPSGPPNPDELQRVLLEKWTDEITELIARAAGRPVEQVRRDAERERWFTASEAAEYGLVDRVVDRPDRLSG
jgi:ATP-dependent Clp protease protease subunit